LEQFTRIELHELTTAEAESAVRAKLTQLYPARGGALPAGLVEALMRRAQGNPFYLEELLNYVRDRGLDPSDIQNLELPDSLHTLILSRIDQLSEAEKITLRVASIVGRFFRAQWLTGYYPELGSFPQVKNSLDTLSGLDITPLDTPEPELAYLFKHIVTHEVTYESLPFATRAKLHEQLARYLESADAPVETIAFHYGRSENGAKQTEYLRRAGEASQKNFANDAALEYYGQLLPLLSDDKEKIQINLKRGEVLELIGKYDEAESDYRAALESAKDDIALKASAQYALGKLNRQRGEYEPALDWLGQAKAAHAQLEDTAGLAQVFIEVGYVYWRKGEYEQAREPLNEGLKLSRKTDDKLITALALNNLGNVAFNQGDTEISRELHEESLVLRRELGYKEGIAASLNNLGNVAYTGGDYFKAQELFEESLIFQREMGNKWGISVLLNNLGLISLAQRDFVTARMLLQESLEFRREMGDKWGIANSLGNLGSVALAEEDYSTAEVLLKESLEVNREIDDKSNLSYSLLGLGLVALAKNSTEAREYILQSLRLRLETGEQVTQISSLIGVAGLLLYEGSLVQAAKVFGAIEAAFKALNAQEEPDHVKFHARILAATQEALGEAAFQDAWEEGSRWTLEETVKKVLE